ncbi:AraC family transcriptional regulator [Coraliomargarita parva]|uniref:AraC family transcriptional regulator n=1 Tax=Coraliomargarita parva TaxID=3014050 RepID=UPI0022B56097|nr:AraC family transcriptional regulator [Coraliomargarita parva]
MSEFSFHDFVDSLRPGQLLEPLFKAIPDLCFFVKDTEGRFVACDDEFCQIMGVDGWGSLVGKTDRDILPSHLAEEYMQDDARVLKSGQPMLGKLELSPNDDLMPDWREVSKIPLFDRANRVVGIAGVARLIRSGSIVQGMPEDTAAALRYIAENFPSEISVSEIAEAGHLSVSTLERRFQSYLNTTPKKYLNKVRLNAACREIRLSRKSFSEVAQDCGFYDQSCLSRAFRAGLQMTPKDYARLVAVSGGK